MLRFPNSNISIAKKNVELLLCHTYVIISLWHIDINAIGILYCFYMLLIQCAYYGSHMIV